MVVSLVQSSNTATLPEELWSELKNAHQQLLAHPKLTKNGQKLDRLIAQVGAIAGISVNTPQGWNQVIQFLDDSRPDWRGYVVRYVSGRDAA